MQTAMMILCRCCCSHRFAQCGKLGYVTCVLVSDAEKFSFSNFSLCFPNISSSLPLSDRYLKENQAVLASLSSMYIRTRRGFMRYGASDSVVSARGRKASCNEQGSTLFFPSNLPQR